MMVIRKNFKVRLLALVTTFAMLLSILSPVSAGADTEFDGYFGITSQDVNVYADETFSSKIGTVYANEGFSLLYFFGRYDYGYYGAYIEYSTPSGARRGYVDWLEAHASIIAPSCIAMVTETSNLYYGTNTSQYQVSGTVYTSELVAVLARNGDWAYVDYNTTSGRKRGYMSFSHLKCYSRSDELSDLYTYNKAGTDMDVSGTFNVRSGPSDQYPIIGSISNETVKYFTYVNYDGLHQWNYIEYDTANGQKKSGFYIGY